MKLVRSNRRENNDQDYFMHLTLQTKKAVLIVARLDRLGRYVEQIAGIVKPKVEIIVVDNPNVNRFTIYILAAVAEEQRRRISETTNEVLCEAKKRGIELGENGKVQSIVNKQVADDFANKLAPLIIRLKNKGIITVRAVSKEPNRNAYQHSVRVENEEPKIWDESFILNGERDIVKFLLNQSSSQVSKLQCSMIIFKANKISLKLSVICRI